MYDFYSICKFLDLSFHSFYRSCQVHESSKVGTVLNEDE